MGLAQDSMKRGKAVAGCVGNTCKGEARGGVVFVVGLRRSCKGLPAGAEDGASQEAALPHV